MVLKQVATKTHPDAVARNYVPRKSRASFNNIIKETCHVQRALRVRCQKDRPRRLRLLVLVITIAARARRQKVFKSCTHIRVREVARGARGGRVGEETSVLHLAVAWRVDTTYTIEHGGLEGGGGHERDRKGKEPLISVAHCTAERNVQLV
jgi:hypothetical protein